MKRKLMVTAIAGALACAFAAPSALAADDLQELKKAIAAQKAQIEAQQAKLDALEKGLNSVKTAQPQAQMPIVVGGVGNLGSSALLLPGVLATGQGLVLQTPEFNIGVYGLIDGTIGNINHANSQGQSLTGMSASVNKAPWFSGARWGITGTRKLTDNLNAIFKLENEYLLRDGSADDSSAAFGRDAWVGFQGDGLGKLTFGRQNTLARDFSQNYGDAYGTANVTLEEGGWTNSNNFKQLIFYAGSASGTRYNNGVVWKKNLGNGLTAGLGYQFGEVTGNQSTGSTQSAALAYSGGHLNLSGFLTHANVAGFADNAASLGGNYTFGPFRLNAGAFHYTGQQGALGTRTDNAYTVSAKFVQNEMMDYELGWQTLRAKNAAFNSAGDNTLNPFGSVLGATKVGTGNKNTTYGSAFYHYNRWMDIYIAADYMTLENGYKVSTANGYKNQLELGVGARMKF